jgi:hypothetical protein
MYVNENKNEVYPKLLSDFSNINTDCPPLSNVDSRPDIVTCLNMSISASHWQSWLLFLAPELHF